METKTQSMTAPKGWTVREMDDDHITATKGPLLVLAHFGSSDGYGMWWRSVSVNNGAGILDLAAIKAVKDEWFGPDATVLMEMRPMASYRRASSVVLWHSSDGAGIDGIQARVMIDGVEKVVKEAG